MSSLLGWSVRWRRLMTLEYLTALHGLPRSIVDAEELQQQAEREFQTGRWGLTFPTSSAGAAWSLGCSGTQT